MTRPSSDIHYQFFAKIFRHFFLYTIFWSRHLGIFYLRSMANDFSGFCNIFTKVCLNICCLYSIITHPFPKYPKTFRQSTWVLFKRKYLQSPAVLSSCTNDKLLVISYSGDTWAQWKNTRHRRLGASQITVIIFSSGAWVRVDVLLFGWRVPERTRLGAWRCRRGFLEGLFEKLI